MGVAENKLKELAEMAKEGEEGSEEYAFTSLRDINFNIKKGQVRKVA